MLIENFYKAQPITESLPVESVTIVIDEAIPTILLADGDVLRKSADLFDEQAARLADALHNSLPQGMFDRLVLEFMRRRVSLYYGIEGIPLDRKLIEWLQAKTECGALTFYYEGGTIRIEDVLGNSFASEDGSLRGALINGYFHDQRIGEANNGNT